MHPRHSSPQVRRWGLPSAQGWLRPCSTVAVVLVAVLVEGTSIATACPMCKAGLASQHDQLIQAWGASIVFLLSMPFILVTSFSAYMYVLVRRARREEAARRAAAADTKVVYQGAEPASLVERETAGV